MGTIVAVSGGKDSTAMALRLAELEEPKVDAWLYTPTGDELPEMEAHFAWLDETLPGGLTRVTGVTLKHLIVHLLGG